jgi:hypothetical protein
MQALRRASRDFKRALVRNHPELIQQRVHELFTAATMLEDLDASPAFSMHASELGKHGRRIRSAVAGEADVERLDTLFGDCMASCIACHHRFRPE